MHGGDRAVHWEGTKWARIGFKSVFSPRCQWAPKPHAKNAAR